MRISLRHTITCEFEKPVSSVLRVLRVTPWAVECQHVDTWRIDVDCDCRLLRGDDCYGNLVDTVSAEQPVKTLSIIAQGEIVTTDTAGVVRNGLKRFPPHFYLRDTDLTASDEALRAFADASVSGKSSLLDKMHDLLVAVCNTMEVETADTAPRTAAQAFRAASGTARDIAHVFIACARHLGAPARFVSGALVPQESDGSTDASHAWAEAYVDRIGWIGFDPVAGLCAHEGHVRVAMAPDYFGAMPMRTAPMLGNSEKVHSHLSAVESAASQSRQERSFGMSQSQFQR